MGARPDPNSRLLESVVKEPSRNLHPQSCFGFEIHSSCPFRFLRRGGGRGVLDVVECSDEINADRGTLLHEWTIRDLEGGVTARLFGSNGLFHFWTSDAGWYRIDPAARRIEMSRHTDDIRREQRLWGIPTALCAKNRGDIVVHGAAVEVDGGTIILAAPGRFGKTTLALMFHRAGYRVLTEDTACCSLTPEPLLYPGPTCIRLRPDMFDGEPPAGTTVAAVRPDRIHLTLDLDRQGDGCPVPIRALVFLRESDETRTVRLSPGEALPDLWTLTFRFQTDDERRRSFSQLAQMAATVPIWNLYRPLQTATLEEVVARLVENVRRTNR